MSEIKPMNLSGGATYQNPATVQAGQESLSEKVRKADQARMMKSMHRYQVKAHKRKEEEYQIGKRTENFVFSHYPSSKPGDSFEATIGSLKFGEGTREKYLKQWKEQVGGNMQGFEQWYQASKAAEQKAIQRSLVRDPLVHKTEESYETYVSQVIGKMSPEDRKAFMSGLSPETLGVINQYYDAGKAYEGGEWGYTFDTMGQHLKDDAFGYGTGVAIGLGTGIALWRKFRKNPGGALKDVAQKSGLIDFDKAPKLLKDASISGKGMSKGQIARMMEDGVITGKEAKALANGETIIPSRVVGGKPIKVMEDIANNTAQRNNVRLIMKAVGNTVADEAVSPKLLPAARLDINKYVRGGQLSQSQGDQLKGLLQTMEKNGEVISPNSLAIKIKEGGKKFEGLSEALKNRTIKSLGPIQKVGFLKSAGIGIGAYYGGSMLGEGVAGMFGSSEHNAELYGEAAGTLTGTGAVMATPLIPKLTSLVKKRGIGWVVQQVGKKAGWQLAARLAAKSVTGPIGWAMLGLDAYLLYDILKDLE